MTDQTPAQHVEPTPVQPEPGKAIDWEARYRGQQAALQAAVEAKKSIEEQLAAKSSELEQLSAQLSLKDAEKSTAIGERDKNIEALVQEKSQIESRLKELGALEAKVKVAKEINRPEVLTILDRIPNIEDPEILKQYVTDMVGWADSLVKAREDQLMAGVVPASGAGAQVVTGPSTPESWVSHIEALPLGSLDRAKAMNEYGDWLEKQQQKR